MARPIPEVAFIGAGGTIASIGKDPFDVLDYGNNDKRLHADDIVAVLPSLDGLARVRPVRFKNIESTEVTSGDWRIWYFCAPNSPKTIRNWRASSSATARRHWRKQPTVCRSPSS
ncbi:hypothetical protein AJ88_11780 [Mesorhizobium amorphae CCBAU 01583]|nr:hypothetical protein AJ88_11780 [Mesorhizobium amorphae CCBAU 01583]